MQNWVITEELTAMPSRFAVIPKGVEGFFDVIHDTQLDKVSSPRCFFDRHASEYRYLDLVDCERIQAIQEIGGTEEAIRMLQQEYDAHGKPYNAREVMQPWIAMIERKS